MGRTGVGAGCNEAASTAILIGHVNVGGKGATLVSQQVPPF